VFSEERTVLRASIVALALLLAPDIPAVLHVEDIVRWHVASVPEGEIVARIHSSAVEFDLSDEMIEELRLAGLSDSILTAMHERQAELHPATPGPSATPEPATSLVLRLRGTKAGAPAHLSLPTQVPPAIASRLSLEDKAPVVTGLALYAACLRATHVPDHWRAESPLGRDFATMPRHQMLLFLPLDAHADKTITAELPPSIEVPLDPSDTHDVDVGVAARIGDRYYRLESDTWKALALAEHPEGLEAEVGSGPSGPHVRFLRPG
jgi:hypothetical protein